MADKQTPKPCPQDCRQCGFQQHAYCAAQMTFTLTNAVNALTERIAKIEETLLTSDLADPKAQEGSGADE